MLVCPRCEGKPEPTGKTWKFGKFDAKSYKCLNCEKIFSAYYSADELSHTVPKN